MAQPSRSPPLSKLVEDAYNYPVDYRLVRGLLNWRRCRDILSGEAPEHAQSYFRKHLKPSQLKCCHVLQDWWRSAYHVQSFMRASQSAFFQSALKVLSGDLEWFHRDPKDGENQYHRQLFTLWLHEFMIYDEDVNEESLSHLLRVRREGLAAAVCQRLAHSVFEVIVRATLRNDLRSDLPEFSEEPHPRYTIAGVVNLSPSVDPCPWLGVEEKCFFEIEPSIEPPHFLWDRVLRCTVTASSYGRNPKYCIVSHTWGRWRLEQDPVHLKGVPWHIPRNSRFDVDNLPDQLDSPFFMERYVWIDLLCIPQITDRVELLAIRDDQIGRQAQIFQGASRVFAWLLEVDDWLGLRWACVWMALKYFRDSQCPGFQDEIGTRLMTAVRQYAHQGTGLVEPWDYDSRPAPHELEPSAWFTSLWTLQEICIRPDMILLNKHMVPFSLANSWIVTFDSLIALVNGYLNSFGWQDYVEANKEVPDLPAIFDRRYLFEAFSMLSEDDARKKFHQETYRTYAEGVAHTWRYATGSNSKNSNLIVDPDRDIDRDWMSEKEYVPKGTAELLCLLRVTGLDELLFVTRIEILWHANGRYCKRSRAEAIMSVVGTTKWYYEGLKKRHLDGRDNSKGLVLQTYPHAFLEEAISSIGAHFFVNQPRFFDLMVPLAVFKHSDGSLQEVRVVSGQGTLLPIVLDRKNLIHQRVYDMPYGACSHPSLATWKLSSKGSFNLQEASILAASSDKDGNDRELIVSMTAPEIGGGISPGSAKGRFDINLREWLRRFMPSEYKAAVVLYSWDRGLSGVILLERKPPVDGIKFDTREFVKVGIWTLMEPTHIPDNQPVNWTVL